MADESGGKRIAGNDAARTDKEPDRDSGLDEGDAATVYFIEHPDVPLEPLLRAYVNRVKKWIEKLDAEEAAQNAAKQQQQQQHAG